MKKMIYQSKFTQPKLLVSGTYKGFEWYVVSYGTHPCCYVAIPEGHKFYKKYYDSLDFDCHGGLTYSGFEKDVIKTDKWLLGWDYAHILDQFGTSIDGHRWSTPELVKEIIGTIDENRLEEK